LKSGDIQAAIGLAQLNRIDVFTQARKDNWSYLRAGLSDLSEKIILPKALEGSDPSWFGFLITVRDDSGISRNEFVKKLNERKIDTRLLFGGNLIKQPAFSDVNFKTIGNLHNSDIVMSNSFWIGVWPGLSYEMLDYVIEVIHEILWSPSEF
jgi:CDP-6-deoxy-D-xylo-4-hexulose-3-dehydrase